MNFAIVPNTSKIDWQDNVSKLIHILRKHDVLIYIFDDYVEYIEKKEGIIFGTRDYCFSNSEVILSLGGDGTLLHTAKYAAEFDIPILGVNTGNLGYMVELEMQDIDEIGKLFEGNYHIDKRMMLHAGIIRNGTAISETIALNDVCVTRGSLARMIEFEIYADNSYIDSYRADGLIVSTPTGSTAYSLSAGGPIMEPQTENIAVIPICPHTLAARPIILAHERIINVSVKDLKHKEAQLACDGEIIGNLLPGDIVTIKKAACYLKLIRIKNRGFYDILRQKLNERRN